MRNKQKPSIAGSESKNLTSVAFERIRTDILFGDLLPNERLRILTLSDRYKLGATAIREALSRLLSDGLVCSEEQRGFSVSPVSRDEIIDITQTRGELESLALTKAITSGDIDWESRVLSSYHKLSRMKPPSMADPAHVPIWSDAHRDFHEALISGCGSPWLIRLCELLYDKSERYRNLSGKQGNSEMRDIDGEHRLIMEAVLAHDAATACKLLSEHFWQTTEIILQFDLDRLNGDDRD